MARGVTPPIALAVFIASCVPRQLPPTPTVEETIDVAAVFASQLPLNNTFYATKGREYLKRVLVAPSLVFAGSRSSQAEPQVQRPPGAVGESTLGAPVDVRLSTLLLDYLAQRGATIIVPAALVRWTRTCTEQPCPSTLSWVERGILTPKAGAADDAPPVPSAILTVRVLGRSSLPVAVAAHRDADKGMIIVRPRAQGSEEALCLWTADVPVVSFSAELIDPADGKLLARIDEHRVPKARSDFRRTVTLPPLKVDQLPRDMVIGPGGDPSLCTALQGGFHEAARDIAEASGGAIDATVYDLLRSTLEPLLKP